MAESGNGFEKRQSKVGNAWAAWCRFWFTPADPTPLCLMRIVTGLLVLYVHVAYTFDLQALFGPDGWYPTKMADQERRESPVLIGSGAWGPAALPPLRMPESADQRHALRLFLEALAADPVRQEQAFRLLRGMPTNDLDQWLYTFEFLRTLPKNPVDREAKLRDMVGASADDPNAEVRFGRYLLGLKPEQREQFRTDAHSLVEVLPDDPIMRRSLIDLLRQQGPRATEVIQDFVVKMINKYPTADQRKAYLDYTEYWSAPPDDPEMLFMGHPTYSPFFHITSRAGINTLHGIHLAIIVLFTLGICTRVTSVMTWLATLAYIQRNPLSLFGQDTMMNLCVFYLMFAPCGATWSVDWLINRYRAGRDALKAGTRPPVELAPKPLISANVVLRLIQVQYCFMYMSAGLSKLKGNSWWTGQAPWYCLTNPEFSPLHIPFFREGLVWLCKDDNRWLWEVSMSTMDFFTLALEIGLPFLVWTRLRPLVVFGAIMMHTGIALNMGLVVFTLFMFTLLLAWMPPAAIRNVFARPPSRLPKLQMKFAGHDPRQRRAAATAYAADFWNQVELIDQGSGKTPVQVAANGQVETGLAAACRLIRELGMTQSVWWLLCPLLKLPGLSNLVTATFGGPAKMQ